MRRLVLSIISLFFMVLCNAQIAPPKQTDTLIITSVKYNFADIDRNNWPCEVIYKSTRDIRIGQQTFNVIEADKEWGTKVVFSVYDAEDNGKKEYELLFDDKGDGTFVLTFSGYEFRCYKKRNVVIKSLTSKYARLKEGHASGNATGEPNARLKGRNTVGTLPTPAYDVHKSGTVVVKIWVDQYGAVQKAIPGAEGTTITDQTLWNAARKAAKKAHFTMSSDAPALQEGTITYVFTM